MAEGLADRRLMREARSHAVAAGVDKTNADAFVGRLYLDGLDADDPGDVKRAKQLVDDEIRRARRRQRSAPKPRSVAAGRALFEERHPRRGGDAA